MRSLIKGDRVHATGYFNGKEDQRALAARNRFVEHYVNTVSDSKLRFNTPGFGADDLSLPSNQASADKLQGWADFALNLKPDAHLPPNPLRSEYDTEHHPY
jgi:hypothetical protein